jgi:hypothetical protein
MCVFFIILLQISMAWNPVGLYKNPRMPFFTCFCSLVVLLQMPPNKFSSAVIAQPACLHSTPKDPPRTDRAQTYLGSSPSFQVIYITDGVTDAKQSSYCVPCPGSLTLEGVLSRVDAISPILCPGSLTLDILFFGHPGSLTLLGPSPFFPVGTVA